MELGIFVFVVISGLIWYVYSQKRASLHDSGRDYYYNRFTRNKGLLRKHINVLEKIIDDSPKNKLVVGANTEMNIEDYLKYLNDYLESEFSENDLKKIKKKKLTYKEKNIFTKRLIEQSDKLYKIEMEITTFMGKGKHANYTLV